MTREIGYTIREMAARCRMTVYTLRYYERVGLIQTVERRRNGHRLYSEADEAWFKFLQSLRAIHMPISEMRRYTALRQNGVEGVREQRKVLEEHRGALEERITRLKEAIAVLAVHIEILQSDEKRAEASLPPLSQRQEQGTYVCRGKLLDFEASRVIPFTLESEPEI